MGFREEIANAAAFESGFDDEREIASAPHQGGGLPAVLKPGIGLGTELALAAGRRSGACH